MICDRLPQASYFPSGEGREGPARVFTGTTILVLAPGLVEPTARAGSGTDLGNIPRSASVSTGSCQRWCREGWHIRLRRTGPRTKGSGSRQKVPTNGGATRRVSSMTKRRYLHPGSSGPILMAWPDWKVTPTSKRWLCNRIAHSGGRSSSPWRCWLVVWMGKLARLADLGHPSLLSLTKKSARAVWIGHSCQDSQGDVSGDLWLGYT